MLSLGFSDLYKKSKNKKDLENSLRNPYSDVRFLHFKSMDDAVDSLIKDLGKFKVHLPDDFEREQLVQGYGEQVCYIVNDLINRELIRRKFTFKPPSKK